MDELIKKLPHTHAYKTNGAAFGLRDVWGPSLLDNTLAGFDAAVPTSLDSSDWLDQSGNEEDTSFTGSPTVTRGQYVSFDGSSQGGTFGPLSGVAAVAFVVRLDPTQVDFATVFSKSTDSNSIRLDGNGNTNRYRVGAGSGNAGDFSHSDGAHYVNGTESNSSELGSWAIVYAIGGDSSDGTLSRMFLPATLSRYGHGDLAEVWFLSSHSEEQRLLFEGYFAHKWGLQHKLPKDHIYRWDGRDFGYSKLWTPASLNTLEGFYEGDNPSNTGSTWADSSGNGNNATTIGSATLESGGYYEFVNDGGFDTGISFDDDNFFIMFVGRVDSLLNSGMVGQASNNRNGATVVDWEIGSVGGSSPSFTFISFNGTNANPSPVAINPVSTGTNYIFGGGVDSSNVYGLGDGSENSNTKNYEIANRFNIHLGGIGAYSLDGRLYDVIILNEYPSESDRQKIEGYFAHKRELTASLPSEHPYKNAPPVL